ncbi:MULTISPECIES: sensor histidine kinase KdpD [unclassified Adlercreutzia]|uniref:sensor histidine kinase n=1 Tax=unclassified Adlercreutzia TaxID=2636013 RepID=UPI0013EA14DE|nr:MULTISPECIES: HAMP domain-containing sensor histidine kinase [unclassified Adlercreutzia]
MAAAQSAQTRALRRHLFRRILIHVGAFTLAFALIALMLDAFVLDAAGNWIADHTSTWTKVSVEKMNAYLESEGTTPSDYQVIWSDDDQLYYVRQLGVYNAFKALKVPVALAVYLGGVIVAALLSVNRSLRYFDELAGAVAGLIADRERPVALSPSLSIVQGELNAVREASLADERAAAAAERRKNELVAYLAHDVRTPLTSVVGYLSLLADAPDLPSETRARYAAVALGKAERLEGLIDEFFEITRYNLQAIPIERATVDVQLFCEQVAEAFYPDAQARGLEIRVEAPADETFFVDPDKLARAVGNMLRNAVAYASEGTVVELRARRSAVTDAWLLTVSNEGREISEAHLQSVFDKFYREDASRASGGGGAGLGLAIAKEIVIAHGGGIRAESAGGVTTFTIALL